jgi:glycerol uptake facilitator-like aquaporin
MSKSLSDKSIKQANKEGSRMHPVTISITFFAVFTTLATTTSTASNEQIDLATLKCKKTNHSNF